jgi:hypothetical protein
MRLGSHEIHSKFAADCDVSRINQEIWNKNSVITCHQLKIKVNEIAQNLDVFLQVAPPLLAKSDDEFSPTNL